MGTPRGLAATCFAVAALLALLGALVVWRVATGPDSDWLVGLITAAPALLLSATLVAVGTRSGGSG